MKIRREFLQYMMQLTAGMTVMDAVEAGDRRPPSDALGELLPLRKFGKTQEPVTMLGVGGSHIAVTSERDAQEVIEAAIQGGVRFFDTAHNYGKGRSEERYGKYLVPKYREHIFLMTKSQAHDEKSLLKEFDLSLQRMGVDSVDLLQLHSLRTPEDVASRLDNGVCKALETILESGKARYVGFTGHQHPNAQLEMLKRLPSSPIFSSIQIPINVVDYSVKHSFTRQVLPTALEEGLGVLAMKTLAAGRFFSKKEVRGKVRWESDTPVVPNALSIKESLYFAWSLPVSVLITGAENRAMLEEKIELAKEFTALTEEDREKLLERVLSIPDREKVEYYKRV
jgi:aryl-alcohol dehydrogenase-like predicted oxidoreductase